MEPVMKRVACVWEHYYQEKHALTMIWGFVETVAAPLALVNIVVAEGLVLLVRTLALLRPAHSWGMSAEIGAMVAVVTWIVETALLIRAAGMLAILIISWASAVG